MSWNERTAFISDVKAKDLNQAMTLKVIKEIVVEIISLRNRSTMNETFINDLKEKIAQQDAEIKTLIHTTKTLGNIL